MTDPFPTVEQAEISLGEPASAWVFRCYEIAVALVDHHLVKGRAVYGMWKGPIADNSKFAHRPLARHGWVLLEDGSIVDPTRWVFEGVEPYIYHGPSDHYDRGANEMRARVREQKMPNPPAWDPDEENFDFNHRVLPGGDDWTFIEKFLEIDIAEQEPGILTKRQVWWLLHRDPAELGEHAKPIYEAVERLGLKAFISIDNWAEVMGTRP